MNKFLAVATACGVLLAGCGGDKTTNTAPDTTPKPDTAGTTADIPTYRVATLLAYPPFTQDDAKGGVEGFDVDVLNHIAELKGFKLEYKPQRIWSGMLEGLDENKHDITASSVFMTPERQAKYDFSTSYTTTGLMLVFKDETASGKAKYTNFDEALKKSYSFTTEFNAPVYSVLTNLLSGRTDVSFVDSVTPYTQISTVLQGKAEAAYDSQRVYEYYIHKLNSDPKTKIYGVLDTTTPVNQVGFAVKKGNTELVQKLNEGLAEMQASGKFQELQKKWFGQAF